MKNQLSPRINILETNILLDGGMEFWPEGLSRSVVNNASLYGASMFQCNNSGMGITITNAQDASVPTSELKFSNKISKTAAGTVGASSAINLQYGIEGFNLQPLMNQEFTVVFWVKSSIASKRSVSIRNSTGSHGYVNQYDINLANTWELKARKFNALSTCPGTINRESTVGILLDFAVVTGPNGSTSSLNQWVTGGVISGTGEDTTFVTGTNHDFAIAGAMVLPGDWTSLEANPSAYKFIRCGRDWSDEANMISRYVEVIGGVSNTPLGVAFSQAPTQAYGHILFKVAKRASPTIVFSSQTGFRYTNATNNYVSTSVSTLISTVHSMAMQLNTSGIVGGNIPGTFDTTGPATITVDARF